VIHAQKVLSDLRIALYADAATIEQIEQLARLPHIAGFTTNPTLMRKAGVVDYREFAMGVLESAEGRPVSFEVLADDAPAIERQARAIGTWGSNVYAKVPITTSDGKPLTDTVGRLSRDGVKVNVTAVFTTAQVEQVVAALAGGAPSVVSLFAGRIADTGRDPIPLMAQARDLCHSNAATQLLWASPREILNVIQADLVGCDIITVLPDLLAKLGTLGKDLDEFSRETVQMFVDDARAAAYTIAIQDRSGPLESTGGVSHV
jgi:transaldolase